MFEGMQGVRHNCQESGSIAVASSSSLLMHILPKLPLGVHTPNGCLCDLHIQAVTSSEQLASLAIVTRNSDLPPFVFRLIWQRMGVIKSHAIEGHALLWSQVL